MGNLLREPAFKQHHARALPLQVCNHRVRLFVRMHSGLKIIETAGTECTSRVVIERQIWIHKNLLTHRHTRLYVIDNCIFRCGCNRTVTRVHTVLRGKGGQEWDQSKQHQSGDRIGIPNTPYASKQFTRDIPAITDPGKYQTVQRLQIHQMNNVRTRYNCRHEQSGDARGNEDVIGRPLVALARAPRFHYRANHDSCREQWQDGYPETWADYKAGD